MSMCAFVRVERHLDPSALVGEANGVREQVPDNLAVAIAACAPTRRRRSTAVRNSCESVPLRVAVSRDTSLTVKAILELSALAIESGDRPPERLSAFIPQRGIALQMSLEN